MHPDIQEVLVTEEQLQKRIEELGRELTQQYKDKNPVIVGVLKGVVVFFADMVRRIQVRCQFDFMWISSYEGTESTGQMVVKKDISTDIRGRHVLILEDIFDTGNSLQFVRDYLLAKGPASLKICTLLDKPERRNPQVTVQPEYVALPSPTRLRWAMGWTTTRGTGICPMWAF